MKKRRLRTFIITELDGKEIKKGRLKRFETSMYWHDCLLDYSKRPPLDLIIAKTLVELKHKIVKVKNGDIIIFDEKKDEGLK